MSGKAKGVGCVIIIMIIIIIIMMIIIIIIITFRGGTPIHYLY